MANILVRNVPDDVHDKLRLLAAQQRTSVADIARAALAAYVQGTQ